jgi:hypothetical protein
VNNFNDFYLTAQRNRNPFNNNAQSIDTERFLSNKSNLINKAKRIALKTR